MSWEVLGNAKLTFDDLNTVLVDVEGTLNLMPLTDAFEEMEDEVLTSSHLICSTKEQFGERVVMERDLSTLG